MQALDGIPRVNRDFVAVSSNFGDYDWFTCPTNGESCSFRHSELAAKAPEKRR